MSIENIVFDMGNVILKYDVDAMLDSFSLTDDEKNILLEKIFLSPLWKDADRGYGFRDVLFHETVKEFSEKLRKVFYALCAVYDFELRFMPLNDGISELIADLKTAGYNVYLLSNVGLGFHLLKEKFPVFSQFDGFYISCDHGYIKPEKEAYETFFSMFSLSPEKCLFIDDSPENISGSEMAGMAAILYDMRKESVDILRNKLSKKNILN